MILLTGGTGLIGSHLLFHLIGRGERVRALYKRKESLEKVSTVFGYYSDRPDQLMAQVEWVHGDITDICSLEEAFEGIQKVFHTAGLVSFDPKDRKRLEQINVQGTAHVVNLCLKHRVKKLCHLSSISAIGPSKKGKMATEENPWEQGQVSVYGQSKMDGELEVWRGSQEGLEMVILNPGVVLGPGHWNKGSGSIFGLVARENNHYIPGGTGFVGVNDLVGAALAAMDSDISCERFIVVDQNLSYGELMEKLAGALGVRSPSKKLPFFVMECLWRLDALACSLSGRPRRLPRALVKGLYQQEIYSSEKIEKRLGIVLDGLDEEIRSSCTMFRNLVPGD